MSPADGVTFALAGGPAAATTAPKSRMLLGTRGFARVVADVRNANKEAQTLFRIEFPYGAASGWKLTYQGYSDGTRDDVHVLAVGVWIRQAASKSLTRRRVTFGKARGVVLASGALRESDGVPEALLPGTRVWVTTWYRAGSTATGLPYQTFLYTKELAGPGTESQDGTLAGARHPHGPHPDRRLRAPRARRSADGRPVLPLPRVSTLVRDGPAAPVLYRDGGHSDFHRRLYQRHER